MSLKKKATKQVLLNDEVVKKLDGVIKRGIESIRDFCVRNAEKFEDKPLSMTRKHARNKATITYCDYLEQWVARFMSMKQVVDLRIGGASQEIADKVVPKVLALTKSMQQMQKLIDTEVVDVIGAICMTYPVTITPDGTSTPNPAEAVVTRFLTPAWHEKISLLRKRSKEIWDELIERSSDMEPTSKEYQRAETVLEMYNQLLEKIVQLEPERTIMTSSAMVLKAFCTIWDTQLFTLATAVKLHRYTPHHQTPIFATQASSLHIAECCDKCATFDIPVFAYSHGGLEPNSSSIYAIDY